METTYNRLAGQSVERLAALSDGVFAIGMTLLVLDLRTPAATNLHSDRALLQALGAMAPQIVAYLMSFLTLGIFWLGQQAQLMHFARSNRHVTWIHLAFLFAVTLLPFSTRLLAEFIRYPSALLIYWANILMLGGTLYASWQCAAHSGLLKEGTSKEIDSAVKRRILIAQALYAAGAAMCAIDTYLSIGFIVLVQLNYAIAPRLWRQR